MQLSYAYIGPDILENPEKRWTISSPENEVVNVAEWADPNDLVDRASRDQAYLS